ncbi:RteC domain-containing protein [Mariniflexile ostreae]|uniref:RteC domain-containing protein n=1 Tax=Mariniflexile ostreae TaxID=1520892 RepID=A0ABV5FG54_9FLAO
MDVSSQIEIFKAIIQDIQHSNTDIIKISQEAIKLCRTTLCSLRGIVKSKGFKSQKEEVQFFKKLKQIPSSYLIYYLEVYAFECQLSKISIQFRQKFSDKTKNHYYQFLMNHIDFVNYIEQGQAHLDICYFTRNQSVQIMMMHTNDYFYDLDFYTSHDMLLTKINGYKRFIDYLEDRINGYSHVSYNSKLEWTSSKVALTELIYALYHSQAINNGHAEIKEIANELQKIFNFDLGDFYRTYLEIRSRKKRKTKFLDELSMCLTSELEKKNS